LQRKKNDGSGDKVEKQTYQTQKNLSVVLRVHGHTMFILYCRHHTVHT
jgi:hypothetical protein